MQSHCCVKKNLNTLFNNLVYPITKGILKAANSEDKLYYTKNYTNSGVIVSQ